MNHLKYFQNWQLVTELRVPRAERVQLWKDDKIIVVVPLTHRALKKYAHGCVWCINSDKGEWEDYHAGKHAIIIQRKPTNKKIGISGNPVSTELWVLDKWESGDWDRESLENVLNFKFENEEQMSNYFQSIGNKIEDFSTGIVYYSPYRGLYDSEDNNLWSYDLTIRDVPNVSEQVIKIMDDYLKSAESSKFKPYDK